MKNHRLFAVVALILAAVPALADRAPQSITIEGVRQGSESLYRMDSIRYTPFDVPEGVTKLTIEREAKMLPSGNGGFSTAVFDSRGIGFPNNGFRGWQEMRTDPVVITADRATTSRQFYPGAIQPGRWYIGQHFRWKSKDVQEVRYKYVITFSFDGPASPGKMYQVQYNPGIIRNKPGWYKLDLHSHTIYSDGQGTLDEIAALHEANGYDGMANTDHNCTTAQYDLPEVAAKHTNSLLIAGEEVTTLTGHANVIGSNAGAWYDPRMVPGDGRLRELIEKVHREGALFSINHPCVTRLGWSFAQEEWKNADAIEVFNGGGFGGDDRAATDLWDGLLKAGRHITAVSGTDTHGKSGNLWNYCWVWAENLSQRAVVEGIRRGHVFVNNGRNAPRAYLSVPGSSALPGDTVRISDRVTVPVQIRVVGGKGMSVRLVWQDGETRIPIDRTFARIEYSVPFSPKLGRSYVRVEVQNANGTASAITNPIYIQRVAD